MKSCALKFVGTWLLLINGLSAQAPFLSSSEKKFLEQVRSPNYVALQAQRTLAQKSQLFYTHLLEREVAREHAQLEKSLAGEWARRDNFEMEELFFKILERNIAPME